MQTVHVGVGLYTCVTGSLTQVTLHVLKISASFTWCLSVTLSSCLPSARFFEMHPALGTKLSILAWMLLNGTSLTCHRVCMQAALKRLKFNEQFRKLSPKSCHLHFAIDGSSRKRKLQNMSTVDKPLKIVQRLRIIFILCSVKIVEMFWNNSIMPRRSNAVW